MEHRESLQTLVNLTPHDIVVYDREGKTVLRRYERSGHTCSVVEKDPAEETGGSVKIIEGMQVLRPRVQTGLSYAPEDCRPDVIVSQITAQYIVSNWTWFRKYFGSVFTPATDMTYSVRDDRGQIIGTKALIQYK